MRRFDKYFWFIIIGVLAFMVAIILGVVMATKSAAPDKKSISSYAECVAAGNPIMESYPEQCRADGRTFTNTDAKAPSGSDQDLTDTVTSGKQAFTVEIPRGWGPVVRASDTDLLMMNGETQPKTDTSKAVEVKTTDAYGHDGPVIFMIGVFEAVDMSIPAGTKTDMTIGKGDAAITGARYAYTYPEDTEEGIGARLAGDRDYVYQFSLKDGKYLRASYHVYGSDPRNLVNQFDNVILSLRVK